MSFSSFTPAQVLAILSAVITVAVAFGVNLTADQADALKGLAVALLAVVAGDAHIRHAIASSMGPGAGGQPPVGTHTRNAPGAK